MWFCYFSFKVFQMVPSGWEEIQMPGLFVTSNPNCKHLSTPSQFHLVTKMLFLYQFFCQHHCLYQNQIVFTKWNMHTMVRYIHPRYHGGRELHKLEIQVVLWLEIGSQPHSSEFPHHLFWRFLCVVGHSHIKSGMMDLLVSYIWIHKRDGKDNRQTEDLTRDFWSWWNIV